MEWFENFGSVNEKSENSNPLFSHSTNFQFQNSSIHTDMTNFM